MVRMNIVIIKFINYFINRDCFEIINKIYIVNYYKKNYNLLTHQILTSLLNTLEKKIV